MPQNIFGSPPFAVHRKTSRGITRSDSKRDLALDFVKGILVIVMVIYHIMNYFSNAGETAFGYVRFVTGSFIFISGYIISIFYEKKYRINRAGTVERLFARGVKLLLIFTGLNLLINLTGIGNPLKAPPDIEQYFENLPEIYFRGNRNFAAFLILLPISYLLMLSPIFLFFNRFKKSLLITTLVIAFCVSFLSVGSENLSLGLVGVIGLCVGMGANELERSFVINGIALILCCLAVCIGLMEYLSRNVITYSLGIMIVLKLFYDLARSVNLEKRVSQLVILLGQYTLVCYIMQIIFLQGMSWILSRQRWGLGYETISIFVITNIFLLGLCISIRALRGRYEPTDKAYRFIFS